MAGLLILISSIQGLNTLVGSLERQRRPKMISTYTAPGVLDLMGHSSPLGGLSMVIPIYWIESGDSRTREAIATCTRHGFS